MELQLKKKPMNVKIIEGFPGFGLVGTIATEYLLNHLETEKIGKISNEGSPAMVAIHDSDVVEPLGIFYNKKYNLVILHAITAVAGLEWKLAEQLNKLAKILKAKEIISIEGVGSKESAADSRVFYYSNIAAGRKKLVQIGTQPLKEGIILGVTGALLLRANAPLTCIFAETFSELPDSSAAARSLEVLDKYLGLKVDVKPLVKQAEEFEQKLKGILTHSKEAQDMADKKKMSYVG
ncbi:MAG: proteasome assembly chaperone family protein [Nanoarchaeota archaeon]|nr:proteasome assembly chaperone family protein [Nanoarchaeota archaeon]